MLRYGFYIERTLSIEEASFRGELWLLRERNVANQKKRFLVVCESYSVPDHILRF